MNNHAGTRFAIALLEIFAFKKIEVVVFTGTLGENSSVPFWCANRAKFIDDPDVPKLIKATYEWYKTAQAPIFMETRTTPGFGYVMHLTMRAKTATVLVQR